MQNKLAVRKIVTFILSFLMIFNLIPSINNVNYNKEVIAVEENKIEESKKQDKDKLKKKIENQKLENENKKSESSNENSINDEGKKIQQEGKLKELKKLALKNEKSEKGLNSIGKNDKVAKNEKVNVESLKKANQTLSEIKGAIPSENDPKDKTEHTELKNVKLLTLKGQEINLLNGIRITDSFKFGFDWDSSYYENTLKEGDYFTVKLPDSFKFSEEAVTITIPLKTNDNNHVIANATITSNGKVGGGNIKAVFTDYVNNKYHIKGKVFLEAYFVKDKVIENQINNIEIWTGLTLQIMILPPNPSPTPKPIIDEIIHKWITKLLDNTKARWNLRINHKKGNFQNVVIRDSLTYEGNPNNPTFQGKYIPASFRLTRVFLDEFGQTIAPAQTVPQNELDAKLTFNPEFTSFELNLGDLNGEQYRLTYESTYDEGLKVKNRAAFIANQVEQAYKEITYAYNNAGGEGDGDLLGKIKIIKVSAEDANLKLKGAKFKITRKTTNETFEMVTGDNGEVVSGLLVPGEYDIQEIEPPVGFLPNDQVYTVNVQQDQPSINTIRNVPEKTSVKVTKQWIGPTKKIKIKLLKAIIDGPVVEVETKELDETTGWEHTFTNLPKYENGIELDYMIEEEDIPGYEKEIKNNGNNNFTIINTNVEQVDVYVRKEWTGPTKEITIKLFKTVGGDTTEVETKVLNETTGWEHTFKNLPKYENGIEIKYTVDEQDIPGYEKEIVEVNGTYHIIRNKNVENVEVKVTKQWIGPEKEVTVKLLKTVNGNVSEVETKVLTAVTGWEHTFTNLPKYENGVEIEYSVDEEDIPGYEKEITNNGNNDFTITNKNVEKVEVYVRKEWIGPTKEVTIKLFKTVGGDTTEVETKVLNETTGWEHTFKNLPKYENGIEIKYTVDEQDIPGYEKEIIEFNNTYHVIRNKNVEKVDVKVKKEWIGPAASEITVNLLANGVNLQSQTLNQGNDWSHTFADLPKYEGVNEIVYTIEEVKVNGYDSQIIKNGENDYTIVNRNNEKTEVKVEKQWIGPVGPEITVNLLANGKLKDSAKLNEGNGWSHTFKNLNVYQDGVDVVYTIEEVNVDGYESKVIKNNENSYVIVNVNKATIEIPVTKEWVGESTSEVTVNLLANGKLKESVKLNAGNNWKHIFKDLPKYDEVSGEEIIYTVSENALEGYETIITGSMENGFRIVNTISGKISIKVTKEWIGEKANSITVNLLADGVKVQSQKLSDDNGWQYVFSDLEKYKDGNEIIYTIEEEEIEGYNSKIKGNANIGFTIVNIEKPDKPEKPGEDDPNKPNKPNKPGNKSKKRNPKTQDMNNINQIILVGTSVALIILTAVVLKEINKKKNSEE